MAHFGPKSIRGKVACIATLVTAGAMAATLAVVAFATQSILAQTIEGSLNDRLDAVEAQLAEGTVPASIGGTGSELVQIIDAEGNVIAASAWADGLPALSAGGLAGGERSSRETASFSLLRAAPADDDEDISSGEGAFEEPAAQEPETAPAPAPAPKPQPAPAPAPKPQPAPAPQPSDDDNENDDSDNDPDNTDDDDSDDDTHKTGYAPGSLGGLFAPAKAYAAEQDAPSEGEGEGTTVEAADLFGQEGPYLIVERGVETPQGTVTVAGAVSLFPAIQAAGTAAALLAGVMLVALALTALFAWVMAARTLRPVEQMRAQAASISASDLSTRLPVPAHDADLSKLACTLNDLLARLEASLAEQRRFVSDASHELKSPIAAIRVMLETMRDHPDVIDPDALMGDLMSENDRIGTVVGDLLLLARQDEGISRTERLPLDLCDLLYDEAASLAARTAGAVEIDVSEVSPIVCTGDAEALSHAVRNLLDNAARYAHATVKLSCSQDGDRTLISVSDDGPGIPPEDRERVFGRFVRLEDARSRTEGSTGLGLAVVKTIAEQHGGTARFVDGELGGATAIVSIEEAGK